MTNTNQVCDLCGLTVEVSGFTLTTKNNLKAFCCEGCKSIFKLLNADQLIPEAAEQETDSNTQKNP